MEKVTCLREQFVILQPVLLALHRVAKIFSFHSSELDPRVLLVWLRYVPIGLVYSKVKQLILTTGMCLNGFVIWFLSDVFQEPEQLKRVQISLLTCDTCQVEGLSRQRCSPTPSFTRLC